MAGNRKVPLIVTTKLINDIKESLKTKSQSATAIEFGVSQGFVFNVSKGYTKATILEDDIPPDPKTEVKTTYEQKSGSIEISAYHQKDSGPKWLNVKNPDELLKACEIDTELWMIDTCRVSSSDVTMRLRRYNKETGERLDDEPITYTNMHVSISLKRKSVSERSVEGLCNQLLQSKWKPAIVKYKTTKDPVLLEWCPYDQHHGMLAWGPEVDDSWDLKLSEEFFDKAAVDVLNKARPYNVAQVLIPIGQDWFHCNDPDYQTPQGKHRLDIEGRLIKVFETGYWSLFRGIERFRRIAPVHLIWVPGNHDPETSYYLVRALASHYMDVDGKFNRGVTVDFAPRSRKLYRWGDSAIGFSHPQRKSDWEKQRGIFSEVFKHEWADANHHEIHTGHLHKIMELQFMTADTLGSHTTIRMLPSLCASDKWHWEQGFVDKNRASASFIWAEKGGLICQFTTRVVEGE